MECEFHEFQHLLRSYSPLFAHHVLKVHSGTRSTVSHFYEYLPNTSDRDFYYY